MKVNQKIVVIKTESSGSLLATWTDCGLGQSMELSRFRYGTTFGHPKFKITFLPGMFDFIDLGRGLDSSCRSNRPRPRLRQVAKPRIVSRSFKHA